MMDPPIVLSDDDTLLTPVRFLNRPKKRRTGTDPEPSSTIPTVVLIDDDPTPQKSGRATFPEFVPETPMSDPVTVKPASPSVGFRLRRDQSDNKFICLDSDNEDDLVRENRKENESLGSFLGMNKDLDRNTFIGSTSTYFGDVDVNEISDDDLTFRSTSLQDDISQIRDSSEKENASIEEIEDTMPKEITNRNKRKKNTSDGTKRTKMTEEEKLRLKEEKLQNKLRKQAFKAEAAKLRKAEIEKKKWGNGKSALKSIVAEIDRKVIEMGLVGGNLLTKFGEKGIKYRITSNPIERSILWNMTIPEDMPEISQDGLEIQYILLVYEAEEFCNLLMNDSLFDHVSRVQSLYPSHTVCYLTNRLMSYVNKREQERYKNSTNRDDWRRPPVEEFFAKLITQFHKVHSRQCIDEAELADHIAGLTLSLASCLFRKKLTRLSVNANGSLVPKDCVDKNLIKNNLWLKVLVAIPKVQPRFAVAIWKRYPTMKSLLGVYMDPTKSDHEKEFLLEDLKTEGLVGEDRRLGEVCSKRLYRILMAKSGCIKTEDVENGADFFHGQRS